jgi:hypothetical protein
MADADYARDPGRARRRLGLDLDVQRIASGRINGC